MSETGSQTPPGPDDRAGADPPGVRHRLDPELAAELAGRGGAYKPPPPVIDTRPYRWAVGIFGIVLVVFFSVYQFASNGVRTAGVPPGKRLQFFAAPLAMSTLHGDANLRPPCTPARHDPRALNICLLASRGPLAVAFFVTGSDDCKRQVDTLQAVSREFPSGTIQFAAVAVRASQARTATLVRSHHWTIPVAYDADGAVGSQYGVAICPLLELAARGGIVKDRLIGNHWLEPAALAARVRRLAGSG